MTTRGSGAAITTIIPGRITRSCTGAGSTAGPRAVVTADGGIGSTVAD